MGRSWNPAFPRRIRSAAPHPRCDTFPLFLIGLVFLMTISYLPADEVLYRSNNLAMIYEQLDGQTAAGMNYVLSIERRGNLEIKRLLKSGLEIRRWERTLVSSSGRSEEREFEEEVLTARRIYTGDELLAEETKYRNDSVVERNVYEYDRGRLRQREVFDGDSNSLYRELYLYTRNGTLRQVDRTYPEGGVSRVSYSFGDRGLIEERVQQDDGFFIARYTGKGKLGAWLEWAEGNPVREKTWDYYPDSGRVKTVTERKQGSEIVETYDAGGLLIGRQADGSENITMTRDESGRLLSKTRISTDGREQWLYVYNENGDLARESYYKRSILERVRIFTGDNEYIEELYQQNALFLRVYFKNEEKMREEFIREGRVIRDRQYTEE